MQSHPWITGKTIVVTGAAGSIGSTLCERILAYAPAEMRLLNLTEHGLAALSRQLGAYEPPMPIRYVLGSVLDPCLMEQLCTKADMVIHAAAYKFVDICEHNPCVAVQNNVAGTWTLLQAARHAHVGRCVLISSDKAVQPCSVMGATKHIAERLIAGMGPGFLTVRFGNVLDSAGSVLPLWREQVGRGGPVTVTDFDCERYFMSCHDACTLVLEMLALDVDHGTFVFDMGERKRLGTMLQEFTNQYPWPIPVQVTGLRPGERLIEELTAGVRRPTAHPLVFQVPAVSPLKGDCFALWNLLRAAYWHDEASTRKHLADLAGEHDGSA